jgi:opacity protein-like surface antigen
MPRCALAAVAVVSVLTSFALAQTPTQTPIQDSTIRDSTPKKFQIFAGYSLFRADTGGLSGPTVDSTLGARAGTYNVTSIFNGWNAEFQYNANSSLGLVFDGNGRYGTPVTAASSSGIIGLPNESGYSLLFGPVFTLKLRPKITPFVHVLFGLDYLKLSSSSASDSAVGVAVGGGIDYKLSPHMSYRIGQLDYFYTSHNFNTVYGDVFGPGNFEDLGTSQSNLRFSTGLVFHF